MAAAALRAARVVMLESVRTPCRHIDPDSSVPTCLLVFDAVCRMWFHLQNTLLDVFVALTEIATMVYAHCIRRARSYFIFM